MIKRCALVFAFLFAFTFAPLPSSAEVEVRHITPPRLDVAHLGKRVLCHRPMRKGSPRFEVERMNDKWVVHHYGHGGGGWTLAPGSARYVIDLLEKEAGALSRETPIAIVGAGAVGLFTALELVHRGYLDLTLIAENFENLPSHHAGGLWAPASLQNSAEAQKVMDQIGADSYTFYQHIINGVHSVIKMGARTMTTYFPDRESSSLEPYVGKVLMPSKDVILDFGTGVSRKMIAYDDGIFLDTGRLMAEMRRHLDLLALKSTIKVSFIQKKLVSLDELQEKVVINCSGIGAQTLNQDKELVSVQGHLQLLKDQNAHDLSHMIVTSATTDSTSQQFPTMRTYYFIPKTLPGAQAGDVGVIGGTYIEGADESTPHEDEFDLLIQRAKEFYGLE